MSKKDTITKEYMQDAEIFADVFNYMLYDGRQVIKPENLHELDATALINLPYGESEKSELLQKYRDVMKMMTAMTDENAAYLILGAENQSEASFVMPVRNMLYDAMSYDKQISQAKKSHQDSKNRGKLSGEYISGFYKTDKLIPVITLVIYWNPEKWTAPRTLHEMLAVQDPKILSYVPDYKINLISPAELEDFGKFHTEFSSAMKFVKYSNDKKSLEKLLKEDPSFKKMSKKTAGMLRVVTGTEMKFKKNIKKGCVDMCQAIEDMKKEIFEEAAEKTKQLEEDTVNMILAVMEMKKCTAEEVMEQMNIPEERRKRYRQLMA